MGELLEQVLAGGPAEATGDVRQELVRLADFVSNRTGFEWFNAGYTNDAPASSRYVALYDPARKQQVMVGEIPHDRMPSEEVLAAAMGGVDWEPQHDVSWRQGGYPGHVRIIPRPHWPGHCWHTPKTKIQYMFACLRHAAYLYLVYRATTVATLAAMEKRPDVETGGTTGLDWRLGLKNIAYETGIDLSELGQEIYPLWSAQCAELLREIASGGVEWTPAHDKEHADLVWLPNEAQSEKGVPKN